MAVLVVLAAAALAVYKGRKNGVPSERAAVEGQADWRPWLIGGSVIAAGALLIFSASARRNWGLILGLEGLLLAAVLSIPEAGEPRAVSGW